MPAAEPRLRRAVRKRAWSDLAIRCILAICALTAIFFGSFFTFGIGRFVNAPGVISFEKSADETLISKRAGILTETFVQDGSDVVKGQALGRLESEASLLGRALAPQLPRGSTLGGSLAANLKGLEGNSLILAPCDGLFVAHGEWDGGLGRKFGLLENIGSVVPRDRFIFEASVSTREIPLVREGQECMVRIWPLGKTRDYVLKGTVLKVSQGPQSDPRTGVGYKIICQMSFGEEARQLLRLGMDGVARIKVGETYLGVLLKRKYFQ